jgi:hypothetical protein
VIKGLSAESFFFSFGFVRIVKQSKVVDTDYVDSETSDSEVGSNDKCVTANFVGIMPKSVPFGFGFVKLKTRKLQIHNLFMYVCMYYLIYVVFAKKHLH